MSPERIPSKTENTESPIIPWSEIQNNLSMLTPVDGGNSDAQRGVLTMANGSKIFVKIGVNEHTKGWAAKEIKSYAFLKENNYAYIPNLVSTNSDQNGFAMDALTPEDGWDWSDTWSKERLDATLAATDALAAIQPDEAHKELLKPVITDEDNGWNKLAASPELQASLLAKLQAISGPDIVTGLTRYVERASSYKVRHDTLVHDDVRADNAAWNQSRNEVKIVDWNWLELGDRRIDLAASLTHIHKSGFDVLKDYSDRLDAETLNWMAGYWLESASKPIWPGGPEKLRNTQLLAGLTALQLAEKVG
jgi:hypothetical protein